MANKQALLSALDDYAVAYRDQLVLRVGRCRDQDEETPPCWMSPDAEQCETCAKRPERRVAQRFAKIKLRRLRRLLLAHLRSKEIA